MIVNTLSDKRYHCRLNKQQKQQVSFVLDLISALCNRSFRKEEKKTKLYMSNGKWDSLSLFPSLGHGVLYLLLIIFCYLTNYPQISHLNNKHVLSHTVSMGQKFKGGLAEVVLDLGARRLQSRGWLTHMTVDRRTQFLAGSQQEASVIQQIGLSVGLLFMASQLTPLRTNDPRSK